MEQLPNVLQGALQACDGLEPHVGAEPLLYAFLNCGDVAAGGSAGGVKSSSTGIDHVGTEAYLKLAMECEVMML